jgi:hypothetical protein
MLRLVLGAILLGMSAMSITTDGNCGNSYAHFLGTASASVGMQCLATDSQPFTAEL